MIQQEKKKIYVGGEQTENKEGTQPTFDSTPWSLSPGMGMDWFGLSMGQIKFG